MAIVGVFESKTLNIEVKKAIRCTSFIQFEGGSGTVLIGYFGCFAEISAVSKTLSGIDRRSSGMQ